MTLGVYAIRDRVAETFQSMTFDVNNAVAKRNFAYAVNNNDNMQFVAKDLELYQIGFFDTATAVITPVQPLVLLARADEVISHDS